MGILSSDDSTAPSTSSSEEHHRQESRCRIRNVFRLLAQREVSPRTKNAFRMLWGKASNLHFGSAESRHGPAIDARRDLLSWVEVASMQRLSAKYCQLLPPPRSTIATAFSPDGKMVASTHGDHTVKLIDFRTGTCLKVLHGHRRTPWVVSFHPLYSEILASGSLDHEVRLWDANTGDCIGSHDFYRPIASMAFHARGELLAVASGHKLFMWQYNRSGETSSPTVILRTRRSIRAVDFHPRLAPFLLTAEVSDLDASDSSITQATSTGFLQYPPPTVYFADAHSSDPFGLADELPLPSLPILMRPSFSTDNFRVSFQHTNGSNSDVQQRDSSATMEVHSGGSAQLFPFGNPTSWELPFLQGCLIGQTQAGQHAMHPCNEASQQAFYASQEMGSAAQLASSRRISRTGSVMAESAGDPQPFVSRFLTEIAASLTEAAAAEMPCTVKLRIWHYDLKSPYSPPHAKRCRLTIPHAVLCSEMGAHFSPCGRFLVACVACMLPCSEADPGLHSQIDQDVNGSASSPTRHPISAHQFIYELRIYSLEEATFGSVLSSRPIRAAHCLTSIQFSATSEHLLLAYGRRHSSLLKRVVMDRQSAVPVYTILEVYRVSDMELVRVIPSSDDEVNVACFHPSPGEGFIYGTKEGRLRIFQYGNSHGTDNSVADLDNENMLEVPTYALEC